MNRRNVLKMFGLLGVAGCLGNNEVELNVSKKEINFPEDSFSIVLVNNSNSTLRANFYNWRLRKKEDQEWFNILPEGFPDVVFELGPGERHTWRIKLDNQSESYIGKEVGSSKKTLELTGFGTGRYSFDTFGWFGDIANKERFTTQFNINSGNLKLRTTGNLSSEKEVGNRLEIILGKQPKTKGDGPFKCVISQTELDQVSSKLILEQIMQVDTLRNGLANLIKKDVDEVLVNNYSNYSNESIFRSTMDFYNVNEMDNSRFPFEFEGQAYQAEII